MAARRIDAAAAMIPELPVRMRKSFSRPSVIMSSDGKVLMSLTTEYRNPKRLGSIPEHVRNAILAAEDKRFYDHQGLDYRGMVRAAWSTVSGKRVEGGSTISMQLAKQVFTNSEKSIDRKMQDIALAMAIERSLTKDQIIEFYMNYVYFGAGAYGVGAAANVYFGKELDELTIAEAALIARCARRPSKENPFSDLETATFNRNLVLATMKEEGWITENEFAGAKAEPVTLVKNSRYVSGSTKLAPYFADYVFRELHRLLPQTDVTKGGYRVETTLDYDLDRYSAERVRQLVRRYQGARVTQGAFMVMDKDGRILAMTGGVDYQRNQFNAVVDGSRQPGSSFKPFIYAAGFEKGILSPRGSIRNDPFMIEDDSGRRRAVRGGGKGGSVSVRSAIAMSINTPAVWANKMVGYNNSVHFAQTRFGFTSDLPPVPTLALGSGSVSLLEMGRAYSTFQNGGDRVEPYGIVKVTDPSGKVIYRGGPVVERLSLSSSAAQGIDYCLRAVVTSGTGRAAGSVTNARGKTGTTSDNKDAWFCGYTDRLIGIGWVGNEYRTSSGAVRYGEMSSSIMGGYIVAPLWAAIVGKAQAKYPEKARSISGGGAVSASRDEEAVEPPAPADEPPADEGERPSGEDDRPDGSKPPDTNVVEDPPVKPVDPENTRGGEGVIAVELCAGSGARATAYCPERVLRRFPADSVPSKGCPTHRPPQ
ncbi:MAG: transglycosylase domain-containing protein [Fimbriimonadaceae bacterium]